MGYEFIDPELNQAMERLEIAEAKELTLSMAFLERFVNTLKTDVEVLQATPQVLALATKVSDLRNTFEKSLVKSGEYLSKTSVTRLAEKIIQSISRNLSGLDARDEIVDRIVAEINQAIADEKNRD